MHNEDVILSRPDNGVEIAIKNRKEHIEKLIATATDTYKFITVPNEKDKTNHCEQQVADILKKFK